MTRAAGCLFAFSFIGFVGAAGAHDRNDTWTRSGDVGSEPITHTTHESWGFSKTGRVEVRDIGGSVQVNASDSGTIEFSYERRARSQQDYDCETLRYEHDQDTLRIWVEPRRDRECRTIYASDTLTLTVPRGAGVSLKQVGDSVKISGVEGLVRLGSVGDSAILSGVQQLEAESIGDTLKLEVSRLGSAGIDIDSVGDTVELTLPEGLDARLRIDSVGDEIRGPGLRLSDHEGYETVLGKGGPMIRIDSVGDSVVIKGPSLKRNR